VQHLAEGLIEANRHAKHRFREEWVRQLVARYRAFPGKPIIHLDDLGDDVIPTLSCERVRPMLVPSWNKLVAERGYERSFLHFRCIRDIAVDARKVSRWSKLRNWRQFSALTGLQVNALEPYVIALRVSHVGTSRVITHPKLPFNLATPAGAKMIGYRGDAAYKTSAFHNKNPILHDDYKRAILETVGINPFTTTSREDGYDRTNAGVFVTMLTSIAGIDNTKRQKKARNPYPGWFFVITDDIVNAGLQALCEAEGSPNKRAVRINQATSFSNVDFGKTCPLWPAKSSVSKLPKETLQTVLQHPPPLLSSAALLLYRHSIVSHLMPERYSRTQSGYSVYWTLSIYRDDNMRKFRDKIGFSTPAKRQKLDKILSKSHKPSSPSPFFSETVGPGTRKRKGGKYSAYAAVYAIPELEKLKADLIVVLDDKGKVFDYLVGPATISDYYGRRNNNTMKILVKQCIEDNFEVSVDVINIHLTTLKAADRLLFRLENK
jgi:hypothetical protein